MGIKIKDNVSANLKALQGKTQTVNNMYARVGVLGKSVARTNIDGSNLTNAEIGAIHEMGSVKTPRRSALRDTLYDVKAKDLRLVIQTLLKNYLKPKSSLTASTVFKRIGAAGESFVDEAFATGGFGRWPALAASTVKMKAKKGLSTAILIATTLYRRSITSDVKNNNEK
jgi:hypothetical protein